MNASQQENTSELAAQGTAQLADVAKHVTTDCSLVMNDIEQAENCAVQGNNDVKLAVLEVNNLNDSLSESTHAMAQLEKESDNITQILDVIRGIAEQTNLLALNAGDRSSTCRRTGKRLCGSS